MHFNLADLWERVADTVPDHEALVCGPRRFTYAQTDERATQLAHVLAGRGVRSGDHVALYLYNGVEYLEGMLAAFKLGAVPINVNYRYVEEELRYLLDDADARAVIFHREFAPKLAALRDSLPSLGTFVVVDDGSDEDAERAVGAIEYEAALEFAPTEREFAERSDDALYILYTGGTTGMPKGVMWRHEDVFFGAMGGASGGGGAAHHARRDRGALSRAAHQVRPRVPVHARHRALDGVQRAVQRRQRDHPDAAPPRRARALAVDLGASRRTSSSSSATRSRGRSSKCSTHLRPKPSTCRRLRVLLSGGAILSPTVKQALVDHLPGVLVVDGYGASETGGQGQSVSVAGGEIASAPRFRVTDDTVVLGDDLRPVADGVVGRLARRGHIPLGYYKDPEKSAATFPVVDGVRWSVPGDHAVVDEDGMITLLGRGSVSINTGGEKVYPEEVEAVLKAHAAVFDAVVVGVPDERFGERVVAVVQARPGTPPTLGRTASARARAHVAGYKIPRDLVVVDAIVRSPSGKPDYRWARAAAGDGLSA